MSRPSTRLQRYFSLPFTSFQRKVVWFFLGTIVLVGMLIFAFVTMRVRRALEHEFSEKGIMMAKHLAYQLENAILTEDYLTIQRFLTQWQSYSKEHGYALVIDRYGQVIAGTFDQEIPQGLVEANSPQGKKLHIIHLYDRHEPYLDVAVPILDGAAGTVRLGVHYNPLFKPVEQIIRLLLLLIALAVALSLVAVVAIRRYFTASIEKIKTATEHFQLEGEKLQIPIRSSDELAPVAATIETLALRLQQHHQRLVASYEKSAETQKLAAIGMLAAGIAHEINNPVAGLTSAVKRIKKYPTKAEMIERYADSMLRSLEHMRQVIQGLLQFSRPTPPKKRPIKVGELVQQSLALISYRFSGNNHVRLEHHCDNHEVQILIDPQQGKQILVNLLINALDAIGDRGTIRVNTTCDLQEVSITIIDDGKGIAEENLQAIWEPFFSTKEEGKGTGLGLTVTRSLVQHNHGRITLQSSVNQGTRVTVSFPRVTERQFA